MAMLQVRDMDDRLYDRLKFAAKRDNRSISQQVITILQNYFTSVPVKPKNATEEFLKLSGSWEDARSTKEIIDDIRNTRVNSTSRRVEYRYYGTLCRYKSEHVFQSKENRRYGFIYCSDGNLQ